MGDYLVQNRYTAASKVFFRVRSGTIYSTTWKEWGYEHFTCFMCDLCEDTFQCFKS